MKKFLLYIPVILCISCSQESKLQDIKGIDMKLCALTFDDGPSADPELTVQVLDNLKKNRIHATFFIIGKNVTAETVPVLKRIEAEGHQIGNHSWSHDKMTGMSAEQIRTSVERTSEIIRKYTGITPVFFRPPSLAVSPNMYKTIDMPFVSGIPGYDWPGGGGDTEEKIVESVLKNMDDGAVILLHDVQPKPHPTPKAVNKLIIKLKEQGYEFVTLSELFRRKGVRPDPDIDMMYVYVN